MERDGTGSLGALRESVAKLKRGEERHAAVGIGPAAVLLADAQRRGQLGDPPLQKGHRRRTGAGRKVQRDVEIRFERLELAEPPRLQARGIAHHDKSAREPLPYGQRATVFGNGSGCDEIGRVAERIINGNRLQPRGGIKTATKELRELVVRETPWFEVETA